MIFAYYIMSMQPASQPATLQMKTFRIVVISFMLIFSHKSEMLRKKRVLPVEHLSGLSREAYTVFSSLTFATAHSVIPFLLCFCDCDYYAN